MAVHPTDDSGQVRLALLTHNAVPDEEAQPYDCCIVRHFSGHDRFLHLLRIYSGKLVDLSIIGLGNVSCGSSSSKVYRIHDLRCPPSREQ